MSNKNIASQTLALAGLLQSTSLVQQLAREGHADEQLMQTSISALFKFEAQEVLEIFGGEGTLNFGLKLICDDCFKSTSARKIELARYCIQLIQLSKKLRASADLSSRLSKRLIQASAYFEDINAYSESELISELSLIYSDLISPIKPRVMVNGEHGYLKQKPIAAQVRASLLCSIRSAYLWWQMGGTRFQLLIASKKYQYQAQQYLLKNAGVSH